jgi:flagellar biosynthetic protein FlhB
VELGKSLLKLILISYVVFVIIQSDKDQFLPLVSMEVADLATVTGSLALKILLRSSLVMLALGILDYVYQRWQHQKDLMMTKQEVKEEHKQTEGNPQIKSKIRSIQKAIARQRMMSKVPQATVVITNPTHYAVALAYERSMEAPKLVAKGKNLIAKRIIAIARSHHISVVQNPPLARALYQQVDLDGTIPFTLYRAVAKVLAYLYQQRQQLHH